MTILFAQDYGKWKKGEVVSHNGGLAERLIGQGKAVPVKAPPLMHHAEEIHEDLLPPSADGTSLQREARDTSSVAARHLPLEGEGFATPQPAGRKRQKKDETPSASFVGTSLTEGG
jgi:hypothetical protein